MEGLNSKNKNIEGGGSPYGHGSTASRNRIPLKVRVK